MPRVAALRSARLPAQASHRRLVLGVAPARAARRNLVLGAAAGSYSAARPVLGTDTVVVTSSCARRGRRLMRRVAALR